MTDADFSLAYHARRAALDGWLVELAELASDYAADLIRAAAPPPTAATPMPARALRPLQAPCGFRTHIGW